MAGTAVGANDALLFRLRDDVPDGPKTLGPVVFVHAMRQQDVDVVRLQFPAETVDVRAHLIRVAGNGFGQNHDLLPRNMLERLSHMRVRTILIGGVIKPQTVVVAPPREVADPWTPKAVWCE